MEKELRAIVMAVVMRRKSPSGQLRLALSYTFLYVLSVMRIASAEKVA